MKTIIHISDMHFGRADVDINEALLKACLTISPDLYVLSGDFTQRATPGEFASARDFVRLLRAPKRNIIAIPGNHDIRPLHLPLARIRAPYDLYEKFIAPHTSSTYGDREVVIGNINTVRASRIKDGAVSRTALNEMATWFDAKPKAAVRILVTHHPLDLPEESKKKKLVSRAARGVYRLAKSRVDLYLSGHYHRSSAVVTNARYTEEHYAAIALQAGTVSMRSRGELQSFNVLKITRKEINITVYLWNPTRASFLPAEKNRFIATVAGWVRESHS